MEQFFFEKRQLFNPVLLFNETSLSFLSYLTRKFEVFSRVNLVYVKSYISLETLKHHKFAARILPCTTTDAILHLALAALLVSPHYLHTRDRWPRSDLFTLLMQSVVIRRTRLLTLVMCVSISIYTVYKINKAWTGFVLYRAYRFAQLYANLYRSKRLVKRR